MEPCGHARSDESLLEALEPRLLMDGSPALQLLATSPALFVENQGQWADSSVRYVHYGDGVNVAMTDAGIAFQVFRQDPADPLCRLEQTATEAQAGGFSASFVGANPVRPVGLEPSGSTFNYFVGDRAAWRSGAASYKTVAYGGLYAGIDLLTWGQRDSLKYEFHVAPGADWRRIAVHYDGIAGLSLDDAGALHVATAMGEMVDGAPYIYQEMGGRQVGVAGEYVLVDGSTYAFEITGAYDPARELVIDPDVAWGSFVSGGDREWGYGVGVDASGNILVAGQTNSAGWVSGGGDTVFNAGSDTASDAFVVKLSPSGEPLWSTYLGGYADESALGVAVDASGNVAVTGWTDSAGWTSGGWNTAFFATGHSAAFVVKLDSSGRHLWSSYLGGDDLGRGVAMDAAGNVLVTGYTDYSGWISGGWDTTGGGGRDGFVVKLGPDGGHLWSSLLGGAGDDAGCAIAADGGMNVLVTGYTNTSGWVSGGWDTSIGAGDGFVVKLSPSGGHVWSSYIGGSRTEAGNGVAVDAWDNVLLTGDTNSSGWVSGGWDTGFDGSGQFTDAYVVKLNSAGEHVWSSYLGGQDVEEGRAVATDPSGNVLVTGWTRSVGWTSAGPDTSLAGGGKDAFVVKLSPSGGHLWSSYLGGDADDQGNAIAADAAGNVLVVGDTYSSAWIGGGWNATYAGFGAGFVVKIRPQVLRLATTVLFLDQPAGAYVGTLATVDPADPAATYTYALAAGYGDADNACFQVAGDRLTAAVLLDYETKPTYTIRVRSTNQYGAWLERQFTVALTNVDPAPTNLWLSCLGTGGFVPAGTLIATISATDPGLPSAPFVYSLVGGDNSSENGLFVVAEDRLTTAEDLAAHRKATYKIRLRVTDAGGAWFEKPFTLLPLLPGDATQDGKVDLEDFGLLKIFFGRTGASWPYADFNGDAKVDLQDFGLLKDRFGQSLPLMGSTAPRGREDLAAEEEEEGIDPATLVIAPALAVATW